MSRIRPDWRRATAWTVIVALFFHAALLLVHHPVRAADGLGNNVVLCSSFGYSIAPLADLSGGHVPDRVPDDKSTPMGISFCPICTAAHFVAPAPVTVEFVLAARVHVTDILRPTRDEHWPVTFFVPGCGPRAPPSARV